MPHSKRKLVFSGGKQINFNCYDCGKKFPSEKFLNKHILISHKNDNVKEVEVFITCDICKEFFPNKSSLDRHRRLNHRNT